jgi:hypothetical protein
MEADLVPTDGWFSSNARAQESAAEALAPV